MGGVINGKGEILKEQEFIDGPTPAEFKMFNDAVTKLKMENPTISRMKIKELIVLDDWRSIGA